MIKNLDPVPIYATEAAIARIAGVSKSVVKRLVIAGEIQVAAELDEGNRRVPIYDPAASIVAAGLVNRRRHAEANFPTPQL